MDIDRMHSGVISTRASESIIFSMHGFACSFTTSLIHSLLHFSQTAFFFRSMRAAGHSLMVGLGKICSLKYDLPWNGASRHIQASQICSPLFAGLGQNAHFKGISELYAELDSRSPARQESPDKLPAWHGKLHHGPVWTLHDLVPSLEWQPKGRRVKKRAKQLWAAVVTGFAVSVVLFNLAYALDSAVLTAPQLVGFFVCMLLRGGVHSATKMDYALIAIPVNAAIYAAAFFIVSRVIWPPNSN